MSRAVHDFDDLRLRSRVDEETGCWVVSGRPHKGSMGIWCPLLQRTMTLTALIAVLMTGRPAPKGTVWVATCGNLMCGNPAHRKQGNRSLLMRTIRPTLTPLHKAKIQRGHLRRSSVYSPAKRAEIMASDDTDAALAQRLGLDRSTVSAVRRNKRWAPAAHGAAGLGGLLP